MTFTEKDFAAQQQQLQALEEELSRLDSQFEAQMKTLGVGPDALNTDQDSALAPEVHKLMQEAQDKAKREGAARAAQNTQAPAAGTKAPGAGRRGAVRL